MKPIIGITTFNENRTRRVYCSISNNYVDSIYRAGGIPILIPIIHGDIEIRRYLDTIDGLLLAGGEDISPMIYGENPIKEVTMISEDRDIQEYKLFLGAMKFNMPVLGICRGIQLMNTASGGTLYQDIHAQRENTLGHSAMETPVYSLYHAVSIERDSKLHEIYKSGCIKVNSFHHQAVKVLANNFKVTATSADGIIEGIEAIGMDFVMGVQWHPEDLTVKYPEHLNLFNTFVEKASVYNEK